MCVNTKNVVRKAVKLSVSKLKKALGSTFLLLQVQVKKCLAGQKKGAPKRPPSSSCSRALFSHTQKHSNPALPNLLPPSAAATAAILAPPHAAIVITPPLPSAATAAASRCRQRSPMPLSTHYHTQPPPSFCRCRCCRHRPLSTAAVVITPPPPSAATIAAFRHCQRSLLPLLSLFLLAVIATTAPG